MIWASQQDLSPSLDTFPKAPFEVDMEYADYGEDDEKLDSNEWEVKSRIQVVIDALNGSKGFKVGTILGIQNIGFIRQCDLEDIMIPQIMSLGESAGKRIAFRFNSVTSRESFTKVPTFSMFTDSRILATKLQSFTNENSNFTFKGGKVWFGTVEEAVDLHKTVAPKEDDVEDRKLMVWGLTVDHTIEDLKQAVKDVLGGEESIWAAVRSGIRSGPYGVVIFPSAGLIETFFQKLGDGALWVKGIATSPCKSRPQRQRKKSDHGQASKMGFQGSGGMVGNST